MNKKKNPPLKELVDLSELQLIQDNFAETVGTSSVIFSPEGEPLTEFSNPTGFCSLIQSTDAGKERCFKSLQEMARGALESEEPEIMYCFAHGGHFVAPIIIGGKHKGTVFAGQFTPSKFSGGQLDDIRQIAGEIGMDPELLLAEAEQMRVVREDVVRNYSSLLFQIVGVIAKLGSQAGELRQARDALQKAHNGLEKRVQERTSELAEANAGLQQEIAERRSAEAALRDSETRFRNIAESISDWIWEVDSDAVYTYCSGNVEDVLGYSAGEILGKTPFDLMAPDMNINVSATFEDAVREKRPFKDLENWLKTRDGRLVCMSSSGVPILDDTGELLGYRGVDSDITERKELERELQQAFDKLKASYEELSIPVIQVWDGVLVLPIMGVLDDMRINRLTETMLHRIADMKASVVILDLTAVRSIDSAVANHLLETVAAARLLGAECILTGIGPEVAAATVRLGLAKMDLVTRGSLQEGLAYAMQRVGRGGLRR